MIFTILVFVVMFLWYLGRGYQKTGNWGEALTYAAGHVVEAYLVGFIMLVALIVIFVAVYHVSGGV